MYKIKVNDRFSFEIESRNNQLWIDGKMVHLDSSPVNKREKHILYQHQSFQTEVIDINRVDKYCKIKVNGRVYEVSLEDQFDQLLKQLGLDQLAANKIQEIKAPMPGLVLKVLVADNAEVKKGDGLVILEAMKMENILKSPADGVIKKVWIKAGDKVEKNQLLIQFA